MPKLYPQTHFEAVVYFFLDIVTTCNADQSRQTFSDCHLANQALSDLLTLCAHMPKSVLNGLLCTLMI